MQSTPSLALVQCSQQWAGHPGVQQWSLLLSDLARCNATGDSGVYCHFRLETGETARSNVYALLFSFSNIASFVGTSYCVHNIINQPFHCN